MEAGLFVGLETEDGRDMGAHLDEIRDYVRAQLTDKFLDELLEKLWASWQDKMGR